jgi:hypothetical protein
LAFPLFGSPLGPGQSVHTRLLSLETPPYILDFRFWIYNYDGVRQQLRQILPEQLLYLVKIERRQTMEALNDKRHLEMVKLLSKAVDSFLDAIKTRGLGFDSAVKEYTQQSDNELSQAFKEYVKAMLMSYQWTKDGVLPLNEDQERYIYG